MKNADAECMQNACEMHMQSYSIFLFEIDSRRQSKFKKGHARAVNSIALNAEESRMASAGDDQKVILWDLTKTSDRQVAVLSSHKMPVKDVVFSKSGDFVFCASDSIKIYDWHSHQLMADLNVERQQLYCLALSPDDSHLFASGDGKIVYRWCTHFFHCDN